jgi:3-(3-hydroxy-phenyl)propionate hydroxylase
MHDIAIVGLGPTGATLANLLAQQGLHVLVLDREADVYQLPRAVHFDGECIRVFQAAGIADALRPQLVVSPGMKFVDAQGRVLIDWSRPTGIGPMGWNPSYRFHQPQLERMLRDRLAQHPSADVRLRHDVYAVDEADDHVQLRIEDASSGKLSVERARYVVGCDGARSLVRRCLGTELDDMRSHERWLVVDVMLQRERPDLGDHSIQFCDPARPSTYVRGVGLRRRWELMLMPGDDPAAITQPAAIWSLLSRWVKPDEAVLERHAVYTFHSVVARGWRRGRLLIAGDAAHQTPPFMGQGMCAGIRDAANLAWKLADVVRGRAPESLLDTYESERSPNVREFIETAVRLGSVIQTTDPEVARRRDEDFAARPQVFTTPQPPLGPGAHIGGAIGGRLAPQAVLADGTRTDDLVGYEHVVIASPSAIADASSVIPAQAGIHAPDGLSILPAHSPVLADWLSTLGAVAALVRPDRYVQDIAQDVATLDRWLREGVTPRVRP